MATVVDLTDLVRGEGEWKNMQEIVRRTFKSCFDQIQLQNDQINKLVGKVRSLKEELATRPDTDEIIKLIECKTRRMPSSSKGNKEEFDRLTHAIVNVKADLERKASTNYVDDMLRRKVDRSDVLVHNLSKITSTQFLGDVNQLQQEIHGLKAQIDSCVNKSSDNFKEVKAFCVGDMGMFKSQLSALEARCAEWCSKSEVTSLVEQKQSVLGLEKMLTTKADNVSLHNMNARLEATLGEHEKLITALRIKVNDDALFHSDTLLRSHPTSSTFGSNNPYYKHNNNSSSSGGIASEEMSREESDIHSLLKSGRIEAIVHGLWHKMNTVTLDSQRSTQDVINVKAHMQTLDNAMKSTAGVKQMETLAAVFEEQRLRLDSIVLGSTPIEPVVKQLKQVESKVSEISSYLQLPQRKPLKEQLNEAGELIEVLSHRVADVTSIVSQNQTKIEALEHSTHSLDSRVRVAENVRERLDNLSKHCDLSETKHSHLRDVSKDVTQMWNRLQQVAGEVKSECVRNCQAMEERLRSCENEVVLADIKITKTETQLREHQESVENGFLHDIAKLNELDTKFAQFQQATQGNMNVVVDKVKELRQSVRATAKGANSSSKRHSSNTSSNNNTGAVPSSGRYNFNRPSLTAVPQPPPPVIFSDSESYINYSEMSDNNNNNNNNSNINISSVLQSAENRDRLTVASLHTDKQHAKPTVTTSTTTSGVADKENVRLTSDAATTTADRGGARVHVAVGSSERVPKPTTRQHYTNNNSPSDLEGSSGINLPAALSLLNNSRYVALTSVEKIDERLETLKAEKEALKQRLLSNADI